MSMNKYMHPRNIYKTPPNFKELALKYPEFKKHIKLDISGKVVFDFKDSDALRALSCVLLKKDFGLDVDIPKNKLIPTIPLRLNYILWIEDLLALLQRTTDIKGIDIGTGASCVYPLMAAKKNQWSMLATEADKYSIDYAQKNIEKNGLEGLVGVIGVTTDKLLTEAVGDDDEFDFCMCNPPFFSSTQELHPFFKSRKQNRPHPKNAFVASVNEVVSKGGEVEFIQKIINESKTLGSKIKVYTTMVGQKCHLPILKKSLREIKINSFAEAEFCQGNTTRWGLAWTFLDYDLHKVPSPVKLAMVPSKIHKPLLYELPNQESSPENIVKVTETLLCMFKELKMTFEDATRNKIHQRLFVNAYSNTWSHQRRRRRGDLRKTSETMKEPAIFDNNNMDFKDDLEDIKKTPVKRTVDQICESTTKKLRLSTDSENSDTSSVFFKFVLSVNNVDSKIILELNTVDESSNREYLHQIMQFIKNNFDRVLKEKHNTDAS